MEALREAGAAEEHVLRAEQEASTWARCGEQNRQVLMDLFKTAELVPREEGDGLTAAQSGAALYDDAGQVFRGLARHWTAVGEPARSQSFKRVLEQLSKHLHGREQMRVLVPGCGLGRLSLEVAAEFDCDVVANDESSAALAAFGGLLKKRHVAFFPALLAGAPGLGDARERFDEAEACIDDRLLDASARVLLEHRNFTRAMSRRIRLTQLPLSF